ncbi:MAG: protein translocase subunit SecD [bacterium]|nr:protein translocase subunit SecD [bacterium]
MKRGKTRTILIFAVLAIALVNVYPTIGWMTLTAEQRADRLEQWRLEDADAGKPNYFKDTWKNLRRWSQCDRDRVINLGLDLQGGIHMIFGLRMDAKMDDLKERYPNWKEEDLIQRAQDETLQRIERRINEFEAKEPLIQAMGTDQIQIQLPGERDLERAKEIITRIAYLEFYLLAGQDKTLSVLKAIDGHFNKDFAPRLQRSGLGSVQPFEIKPEQYAIVQDMVKEAKKVEGLIPEDAMLAFSRKPKEWAKNQNYLMYVLEAPRAMSGEGLERAIAMRDEQSAGDRFKILFELDIDSGRQFGELTEANTGRNLAVVVDGVVESAPTINSTIYTSGEITGSFDGYEARDLAIALTSGAMNVPLDEDMTGVVGPTLGSASIQKGVYSAVIGLAIVILFMAIYYRYAGIVADLALMVNALLVIAALAYFNATLTLPGIAGMILTIGMAVDANVLIFERIREEVRNGKSVLASIDSGFARATVTILDANVTTLIAAAVLMEFGTGPIEGFAVTLSIGVCTSVFAALIVSRAMFDFAADKGLLKNLTMMSVVKPETKVKFLEKRRVAVIVSIVVIGIGLAMFGVRGNDNFGVDFNPGTSMVVNLQAPGVLAETDVSRALTDAGFTNPSVVDYEKEDSDSANQFLIRVDETGEEEDASEGAAEAAVSEPAEEEAPEQMADATSLVSQRIEEALVAAGVCDSVETVKVDTVGPAVGKQLKRDAVWAIAVAMIFIIAYLWFRFELKFAVGAVVALMHDVLVTVGLFALFQRQISLPVVAALLTIIGYSLNDTIVVFDRIREDLRLYRGRGLSFAEILNISINQTLSRTLLTSLTTLFVVMVLWIFGGEVIRDFSFALIAGVIVGTYSSVFIASPVVYLWQKIQGKHLAHPGQSGGNRPSGGNRRKRKKKSGSDDAKATT